MRLKNERLLKILRGHLSSVRAVAYHPNGLFIVSASIDGEVKLWSSIFASQVRISLNATNAQSYKFCIPDRFVQRALRSRNKINIY